MKNLPLDGVTVLELGNSIAAPFAGEILGDLGADVIKIEPPDGDPFRSHPAWLASSSSSVTKIASTCGNDGRGFRATASAVNPTVEMAPAPCIRGHARQATAME